MNCPELCSDRENISLVEEDGGSIYILLAWKTLRHLLCEKVLRDWKAAHSGAGPVCLGHRLSNPIIVEEVYHIARLVEGGLVGTIIGTRVCECHIPEQFRNDGTDVF